MERRQQSLRGGPGTRSPRPPAPRPVPAARHPRLAPRPPGHRALGAPLQPARSGRQAPNGGSRALLLANLCADGLDVTGEALLFLAEKVFADAVLVVQIQELPPLLARRLQRSRRPTPRPAGCRLRGVTRLAVLHLPADGLPEPLVLADEHHPEHCGPQEPEVRPSRLATSLAPVAAAVEHATLAVLVDGHTLATQPAAHAARQQVPPAAPAGNEARLAAATSSGVTKGSCLPGNHWPLCGTSPR